MRPTCAIIQPSTAHHRGSPVTACDITGSAYPNANHVTTLIPSHELTYGHLELSAQLEPGSLPPTQSPVRGIAGLVVANSSLMIAGLVYMGWAYVDALYGYFHINVLDLGVGILEYVLRSLSLFSPAIVIAAVAFITVGAIRAWDLNQAKFATPIARWAAAYVTSPFPRIAFIGDRQQAATRQVLLIAAGTAVTVTSLALSWLASDVHISTYVLLSLLGGGSLLLTRPTRAHRHGRFPYALAIVVAAVCALWAASLYAHDLGIRTAQNVVRGLPARTAVAVYSIQPLALSGPGVTVQRLPAAFRYHYRYEGLRLLISRSSTYYLLPVGWTPQLDLTYIFSESDQTRIELYSGVRPAN